MQVKDINYALLNKSIKIFEGADLTYKLGSDWGGLSQSYKTSYSAYFFDNAIPDPTIVNGYLASFTKDVVTTLDAISLKIA